MKFIFIFFLVLSVSLGGSKVKIILNSGEIYLGNIDNEYIELYTDYGSLNIPISAISEIYMLDLVGFDNFDFEKGFKGWRRTGKGHQIESYVSDYKKAYQGNYAYQTCPGNTPISYKIDSLTNELVSDVFLLNKDKSVFSGYIFGGGNKDLLYVSLILAGSDKEICRLYKSHNGANWEYVERSFSLTQDMMVYIKIVDKACTRWGHIAVDQIEIK